MGRTANDYLKIERGIPAPVGVKKYGSLTATLRRMKVGDSVLIPMPIHNVHSAISQFRRSSAKTMALKFVARTLANGVRVWRIANEISKPQ